MEVSKKQSYIFKSNKLKENVGASMIIRFVTEDLPEKKLKELKNRGKSSARALLVGGGKSIYYFDKDEDAKSFVGELSYQILEDYPELEMFFVTVPADIEKDNILKKIDEAYKKLGEKKSRRASCYYQMSFGKEEICHSTGMPAVYIEDEWKYGKERNKLLLSEESKSKLDVIVTKKLQDELNKYTESEKLISEIDEFVEGESKSYIAIIHIDGNKMGKKFDEIKAKHEKQEIKDMKQFNEAYLEEMDGFSKKIEACYKEAFKAMCIRYKKEKKETKIRPIVLAGDDVCFVAKAKDAIWLAKAFLDEIGKKSVHEYKLCACAGIAIVKRGYPFARAYRLSEELCQNCKDTIVREGLKDTNMLDWHIVQGEMKESLGQMRQEYQVDEKTSLTLKPLLAGEDYKGQINHYDNFKVLVKKLLEDIEKGDLARSKVKELRNIYKEGKAATEVYMRITGLEKDNQNHVENKLDFAGNLKVNFGFYTEGERCFATHYDAIEMIDIIQNL